MASEVRKVVIELNAFGQPGGGGGGGGSGNTNLNVFLHPIKAVENQILGKSVLVNQAYQQTKTLLKNAITYQIYRNFTLKEDYIGEQDFKNTMISLNKVVGFGESVIAGAVAGGMAGGAGAIVGAVIGGVGFVINEQINLSKRMDSAYLSLNNSNIQVGFGQVRAGLIDGGKGTQN